MKKSMLFLAFVLGNVHIIWGNMHEKNNNQRPIYFCILAGGDGERLWPLSKIGTPKQLLSFGNQRTFLQQAIDRIRVLAQTQDKIWIITSEKHENAIRDCVGDEVGTILVEPKAHNTGPAILYTCLTIQHIDPDALIVFLPSDPFIPLHDNEKFAHYLQNAINFVSSHDEIALLGVKPTFPATSYGYIEFDKHHNHATTGLYKVARFREKPNRALAEKYLHQQNMLWNISMFCGPASVFINSFATLEPELFVALSAYMHGNGKYEDIRSISVDYAIIERNPHVWVLPVDFTWHDVGNIHIFLTLKKQHDRLNGELIEIDAKNNLVDVPNKLVALIGVQDLCIVQTEHALLITNKEHSEKVKNVVNALKEQNSKTYL